MLISLPSSQAMEVPSLDGLAISQDPQAIKAAEELKAKEEEKAKQVGLSMCLVFLD